MDAQKIKKIALANGFSLKEQASGNMDLNSYVYEFAQALIAEAQKVTELKANWIADCNKCGHADAVIYSTAGEIIKGQFFDRDKVKCLHCGHTGEMDARGEDSDVEWDECESSSKENLAIFDVLNERKRQIEQKQYSPEHDDKYDQNELIRAASSYLNHVVGRHWVCESKSFGVNVYQSEEAPDLWPWDSDFWKPKNPRRDLVRAAALIIAEIEKIDRNIEREAVSWCSAGKT